MGAPGDGEDELWGELGADMRILRVAASMSIRQTEVRSGWGRGTLSQVENGKARPAQALVEWYDDEFGGDGLLVALYVEAKVWHGRSIGPTSQVAQQTPGDDFALEAASVPAGELVGPDDDVKVGWTIRNSGRVPWRGRALRRVGAIGANRLIVSRRQELIPDLEPEQRAEIQFGVTAPQVCGTVAAHWEIVDAEGRPCFPGRIAAEVLLVVA